MRRPRSLRDAIEGEHGYRGAREFARKHIPKDGVEYAWVHAYAREQYERFARSVELLDGKADSLAQYTGGGSALLAAAAAASIQANVLFGLLLLPSLVLVFLALRRAVLARCPGDSPFPPALPTAVAYAEKYRSADRSTAHFMPLYHQAAEALKAVCIVKGRELQAASVYLLWGFALLALPLVGAIGLALLN